MIAHFCESQDCAWCKAVETQTRVAQLEKENKRLTLVIRDLQRKGRAFRQPRPGSAYDLPAFALYRLKRSHES